MPTIRRRIGTLLLLFLVVGGFFGTVVIAEGQRTPDWQVAFSQAVPGVSITESVHATKPSAFDETMAVHLVDRGDMLALPGAPLALHCVLGKRRGQMQLYFVAFYDDALWHADWVVWASEGKFVDSDVQQIAAAVGCR